MALHYKSLKSPYFPPFFLFFDQNPDCKQNHFYRHFCAVPKHNNLSHNTRRTLKIQGFSTYPKSLFPAHILTRILTANRNVWNMNKMRKNRIFKIFVLFRWNFQNYQKNPGHKSGSQSPKMLTNRISHGKISKKSKELKSETM